MLEILGLLEDLRKPGGGKIVRSKIASRGAPDKDVGTAKKSETMTRPKRPAPKKPPTAKSRERKGSAAEPLIISNPAVSDVENGGGLEKSEETETAKQPVSEAQQPASKAKQPVSQTQQKTKKKTKRDLTSSVEPLIASSGSHSSTPPYKRGSPIQEPRKTKTSSTTDSSKTNKTGGGKKKTKGKGKKTVNATNPLHSGVDGDPNPAEDTKPPPSPIKFATETVGDGELPLPAEMSEATNEAEMMKTKEAEGGEDDFILEPPERFSQNSLDNELELEGGEHSVQEFTYQFGPDELLGDDSEEDDGSLADPPPEASSKVKRQARDLARMNEKWSKWKQKDMTEKKSEDVSSPPPWTSEDQEFDDFDGDQYDALEDDDAPNVVYDEDVAALLW